MKVEAMENSKRLVIDDVLISAGKMLGTTDSLATTMTNATIETEQRTTMWSTVEQCPIAG